jgi:hypothetical protein
MIIEVKVYSIICDSCKKDALEDSGYCGFNDTDAICIDDWATEGDQHYCPDCHSFDDEDNLLIKTK